MGKKTLLQSFVLLAIRGEPLGTVISLPELYEKVKHLLKWGHLQTRRPTYLLSATSFKNVPSGVISRMNHGGRTTSVGQFVMPKTPEY
jgi:hypothetical protein